MKRLGGVAAVATENTDWASRSVLRSTVPCTDPAMKILPVLVLLFPLVAFAGPKGGDTVVRPA